MKQILHILLIALMLMGFYSCVPKTELASPDGHIKVAFTADTDGKMMYRVTVNDTLLLDNSPLGFEAKDGIDLNRGFRVVNTLPIKTRSGRSLGERIKRTGIIIMKWRFF